jgi:hypothetical protein
VKPHADSEFTKSGLREGLASVGLPTFT